MTDVVCPDCEGEGKLERYHPDGPYDIPCPYCYNSCGMIPSSEEEEQMKCDECKNENDTISNNEFNKLLCDDCYTNYRVTLQNMFNLKNLFEVDDLLSNITGDSEDFFKDRELDK